MCKGVQCWEGGGEGEREGEREREGGERRGGGKRGGEGMGRGGGEEEGKGEEQLVVAPLCSELPLTTTMLNCEHPTFSTFYGYDRY